MNDPTAHVAQFSAFQLEQLARRGITTMDAIRAGVLPVEHEPQLPAGVPDYWTVEAGYLPGLLIPWVAEDGRTEHQIRPDNPPADASGRLIKYATRGRADGYEPVLWVARRGDPDGIRMITEGTCQTIAAAAYAPEGAWVLGIVGCRGWMDAGTPVVDLNLVQDADVVICLDADMWSNRGVWDAGQVLQQAVRAEGASSVKFLKLPAGKKTGLDDLLGSREPDRRGAYLASLVRDAVAERFPASRAPKLKKSERAALAAEGGEDGDSPYLGPNGLLVKTLASDVHAGSPAALTQEGTVALYSSGFYRINPLGFTEAIARLMGEDFRTSHVSNTEEYMAGMLYGAGMVLPSLTRSPLLNVRNGMLDLRTRELLPHDPEHMSTFQLPVEWDPDAKAPFYEAWLAERCGDQVDDLEETLAQMLDPSRRATKAAFLFGAARSGKSTVLRVCQEMVGDEHSSAVSLDQMCNDKFAAANLYGKRLNVVGEVAASHLEDITLFKKLTGEDKVHADRKYGKQFSFTSQALHVFSANSLPTVGEGSRAYTERVRPFHFPHTYAGMEDPAVEERVVSELPGILVRWVEAWRRRRERGRWLETSEQVRHEFDRKSDRVRMFLDEACTVGEGFSTATELTQAFKVYAEANGGKPIGRNKLAERLEHAPGVEEARDANRRRGYNIRIRRAGDWGFREDRATSESARAEVPAPRTAPEPPLETAQGSGQELGETGVKVDIPSPREPLERAVRAVPSLPRHVKKIQSLVDHQEFDVFSISAGRAETAQSALPDEWVEILGTACRPGPGELECSRCGAVRELVPPTSFWYDCRNCSPASFTR